ncbi:hypothetical protein PAHAL_2G406300 [Panicum hallii]|jgi:hypothetical protein|uniref:F-box domain-containing protein n=1 Tax=Panicum hallii TaxID=206008 RepID=A0A2S3H378_9POAL|nr:uncharacterized protein LOC112881270 [Panicum hallii]PAN14394.1 hypothetical protein PAHAL_2G406300 [Panicum hallii]
MTSPPHRRILPRLEAPAPPRQPPALNEDLLEDILLRVASPADLVRATATCRSLRRIITNPSFHRRYRSLYPPLLLGILCDGIQPAAAPHPNAPAARSLANAAGFSFECYLPGDRWQRCDVRDGRLLLERLLVDDDSVFFPELAVCDPVYRRFRLLPPIPEELIAYAQVQDNKTRFFEAFLVPSGQEGTSFKVIGRTHCNDELVVFIFSSDSNLWSLGTSTSWADLGLSAAPPNFVLGWPQYEHGCFYWKVNWRNKLLKLDMDRMEFSTVDLPPGNNGREVVIVEPGEGRLGMFSLTRDGTDVHYFTSMKSKGEEAKEWLVENTIPLPCNCNIVGAFEGYIFFLSVETHQGRVEAVCYSLEIKTLKIERVNSMNYLYVHIHAYFGYPPFMSPRKI